MDHHTKETSGKVKSKGEENLWGKMAPNMRVSSRTTAIMARERLNGQMARNMWVNGLKIRWQGRGPFTGRMVRNIQETSTAVKGMDRELLNGIHFVSDSGYPNYHC